MSLLERIILIGAAALSFTAASEFLSPSSAFAGEPTKKRAKMVGSGKEKNTVKLEDRLAEADNLAKQGKSEEAGKLYFELDLYKKAAEQLSITTKNLDEKRPKEERADLFYRLGFAYGESKQWDKGLDAYRSGAKLHLVSRKGIALKYQKTSDLCAEATRDKKNPKKSIKLLLKAHELEPDHPGPLNDLAWAYIRDGKTDKGISYFKKAIKLKPGYLAVGSVGTAAYMKKDWQLCKFSYQAELILNPDSKFKNVLSKRIAECEKHLNNNK